MKIYTILNSRVPAGGRHLTSAEARALRREGVSCSEAYTVSPFAPDINYGGPVYKSARGGGGLDNTGIMVTTK